MGAETTMAMAFQNYQDDEAQFGEWPNILRREIVSGGEQQQAEEEMMVFQALVQGLCRQGPGLCMRDWCPKICILQIFVTRSNPSSSVEDRKECFVTRKESSR